MTVWLGVDVGGRRKRFDLALVDETRLVDYRQGLGHAGVAEFVEQHQPELVAIDGPRSCAPAGQTSRLCERSLARAVCDIRWTPDAERLVGNPYYEWVREGLALFAQLKELGVPAIEVFPTAAWTRWHGPRGHRSRARWSAEALAELRLDGVPDRTNQDQRDAIAAAVTAREHALGSTETFADEIVVPLGALHQRHRHHHRQK